MLFIYIDSKTNYILHYNIATLYLLPNNCSLKPLSCENMYLKLQCIIHFKIFIKF